MTQSETIVEMHAVFSGRVQGVGFRYTAQKFALDLNLKGTVRNVPDGTVEIYAQGSKENLKELVDRLRSYFKGSQVTIQDYTPQNQKFSNFTISY